MLPVQRIQHFEKNLAHYPANSTAIQYEFFSGTPLLDEEHGLVQSGRDVEHQLTHVLGGVGVHYHGCCPRTMIGRLCLVESNK